MIEEKIKYGFGGTYITHMQEDLSLAYMQVICAQTGFNYLKPERDNDGIDIVVRGKGFIGNVKEPKLEIQLKCCLEIEAINYQKKHIKFVLEAKNYNKLNDNIYPSILVVHIAPKSHKEWVQQNALGTTLRFASYWYSLDGMPDIKSQKTLYIPFEQVLDSDALCKIMKAASEGRKINNLGASEA